MPISRTPPGEAPVEYYYRRDLGLRDLVPALGAGVGLGLVAFYVMRVVLQRTPLTVPRLQRAAAAAEDDLRDMLTDPATERPARLKPRAILSDDEELRGAPSTAAEEGVRSGIKMFEEEGGARYTAPVTPQRAHDVRGGRGARGGKGG